MSAVLSFVSGHDDDDDDDDDDEFSLNKHLTTELHQYNLLLFVFL